MGERLGWVAAGRIVAPPLETFAFDDVAAAHAAIESGRTIGKLALVP